MSELPFASAKLIELWCTEPVFFASRELSDTYYTEGAIGNYALAYAFGWANSPYRLQGQATGRPTYREDFQSIAASCYVLPASPMNGRVTFRFERFNALSDSYWYAMTNNRVATAREDLPLQRQGTKPNSFRASNFPQTGRLRMIERHNKFHTLVLGSKELPEYIRLGKFRRKVKVTVLADFSLISLTPNLFPILSPSIIFTYFFFFFLGEKTDSSLVLACLCFNCSSTISQLSCGK